MESLITEQFDNGEFVTHFTGIEDDERKKLFKYAAKLPDGSLRKAMSSAVDFFYQKKAQHPNVSKAVLIHCGYLLALKNYHYAQHKAMKRKNSHKHVETIDDLKREQFLHTKKPKAALLKNKIRVYLTEIHFARKEGMSYKNISLYLKTEYRINVSSEYVRRIINGTN